MAFEAHNYTWDTDMGDKKLAKDRNRLHLYWTAEDRERLERVGAKLEAGKVKGLRKRDGSFNASAVLAALLRRELGE